MLLWYMAAIFKTENGAVLSCLCSFYDSFVVIMVLLSYPFCISGYTIRDARQVMVEAATPSYEVLMFEYQKIKKNHIYETIAQQLREQIVSGSIKPGQKLPSTKELSESFQVGRSTVREALSALRAMGLIEIRQGEGSYVKSITPSDVDIPDLDVLLMHRDTLLELLEARKALEVANAGLSAEKRSEEDLQQLSHILNKMQSHIGDEEIGEEMDVAFHKALAQSTHNTIMVRLLESISGQLETSIRETRRLYLYADSTVSKRLWEQHQQIYSAIAEQNAELAQRSMQEHLLFVEALIQQRVN